MYLFMSSVISTFLGSVVSNLNYLCHVIDVVFLKVRVLTVVNFSQASLLRHLSPI
jgi:hypothetical protein